MSGAPRTRRWLLRIGAVIIGLDLLILVIAVPAVSDGESVGTALGFLVLLAGATLLAVPFLVVGGILWLLELPQRVYFPALALIAGISLVAFVVLVEPYDWTTFRCSKAPDALVQHIETKLHRGLSLGSGSVVRSKDFDHVWFVSAGFEGTNPHDFSVFDTIGVWATDRLDPPTSEDEPWQVRSVGWVALATSDWDDGAEVSLGSQGTITNRAEGAFLARRCSE